MFCDLVDSTALSARLDPEDLRDVIGAYHRAVADVVRSFDGFVTKFIGDGVLVDFGYPQAHVGVLRLYRQRFAAVVPDRRHALRRRDGVAPRARLRASDAVA